MGIELYICLPEFYCVFVTALEADAEVLKMEVVIEHLRHEEHGESHGSERQ